MNKFWHGLVDKILKTSTRTFGDEVTFYPRVGGVYKMLGVFDNDYQFIDADTEHLISANQPTLGINLNDLEFEMKQGDEVQVRDTRYRVTDKREDGQGGALLMLQKINATSETQDTRIRSRSTY